MAIHRTTSKNSAASPSRLLKKLLSGLTGTSARKQEPTSNSIRRIKHCPDTGKDYQDWPISDVHYHYMHDMLSRDAMILGIAYRMTEKQIYGQHAAEILKLYADK